MSDGAQEDDSSRPEGQSVAMRTPLASWASWSCSPFLLSAVAREETVCKAILRTDQQGENLLKKSAWQPFEQGCDRAGEQFVCDNGERAAEARSSTERDLERVGTPADRGIGLEQGRGGLGCQRL